MNKGMKIIIGMVLVMVALCVFYIYDAFSASQESGAITAKPAVAYGVYTTDGQGVHSIAPWKVDSDGKIQ